MSFAPLKGWTARQLLEALQDLTDEQLDCVIVHQSNYGDYSRTQQALPIKCLVEEGFAERSSYSNGTHAIVDLDDELQEALDAAEPETMEEEHEARLQFLKEAETKYTKVVVLKMTEC